MTAFRLAFHAASRAARRVSCATWGHLKEEPELRDYPSPKDFPEFKTRYGPRGVLHCWADGKGAQRIENTGPLTKKRMETVDKEFLAAAKDFGTRQHQAGTPFFVWFNTTHMHFRTHAKPQSLGQSGRWQSAYHDVMIDHDKHVGELLALLDELGIADTTFVMYSTDNGPHMNSWPDAGMTPFRNEKNSNWEGAFRVPAMVRWPGEIPEPAPPPGSLLTVGRMKALATRKADSRVDQEGARALGTLLAP